MPRPPSFLAPPLSVKSRGAHQPLMSARREARFFFSELRIEVHLDMLVRLGISGVGHGSDSLRAFDTSRRSSSPSVVRVRHSPVLSPSEFARYARWRPRCGGSVRFTPPWTFPKWAWPSAQVHRMKILHTQGSGLGFTPPLRFSESRVTKGVVFLRGGKTRECLGCRPERVNTAVPLSGAGWDVGL